MSERRPDLAGGACTDLPPQVVDKYFNANGSTDRFFARTAIAICSHCPVQPECLEAALKRPYPSRGVVGGFTARAIRVAQAWQDYDNGFRDTPPDRARPQMPASYRPSPAAEASETRREKASLSFEEQVYGVFLDVRQGRYQTLNQAIGEIALIHSRIVGELAGSETQRRKTIAELNGSGREDV